LLLLVSAHQVAAVATGLAYRQPGCRCAAALTDCGTLAQGFLGNPIFSSVKVSSARPQPPSTTSSTKERNVTRAGMRIGRTQPAMSASLARLRHLLKDDLFVRSAAGLRPTPRAMELDAPISSALAQLQQTLEFTQSFDASRSTATFTLGVSEHPAFAVLPRLLRALSVAAPGVPLRVKSFIVRERAVEMLDAGEVDAAVGVLGATTPRIATASMFTERFVCVLRNAHPLATSPLTLDAFLSLSHILVLPEGDGVGHVDIELEQLGKKRKIGLLLPQMYTAPAIVASSEFIATLMEGVVIHSGFREQLAVLPLPIRLAGIPFVLHWHRRNDAHFGQRWFRERVLEVGAAIEADARKQEGVV
jgi:DNA-binding transcriptional LysR family regulator